LSRERLGERVLFAPDLDEAQRLFGSKPLLDERVRKILAFKAKWGLFGAAVRRQSGAAGRR
jgi:hypothetical protein